MKDSSQKKVVPHFGFTIVELLIVIVVIAILAAITLVAYNGVQARARQSKITSDLSELQKAILVAREAQTTTLFGITGSTYTASNCVSKAAGTDLSSLPSSDGCWTAYNAMLSKISVASGITVTGIKDPWGRPYFMDENEGEGGGCRQDVLAAYAQPFSGSTQYPSSSVSIPLSGYSGCS